MESMLRQQIQAACDELYHDPRDENAFARLHRLLGAASGASADTIGGVVPELSWRAMVKNACDNLYDDPDDGEARTRLLLLLAAARQ
ncbi:hypothetical protein [Mycobacterium sp. C31M]